jgi:hypothetical protein
MQRLLLDAVPQLLEEPFMGLFQTPRAACTHPACWAYVCTLGATHGLCLCQIVRRDDLLHRTWWARHQAGDPVTREVHTASAARALTGLLRTGQLCRVWPISVYNTYPRCPDCGAKEGFHPLHPRHLARTVAVTLPDLRPWLPVETA